MPVQKTDCSPAYIPVVTSFAQRVYHRFSGLNNYAIDNLNCASDELQADATLASRLRQAMNALKLEAISEDGSAVDYAKLKDSPAYEQFQALAQQLQGFPLQSLRTNDEKLAFWINIYNVMVLDAVIQLGVKKTVRDVRGFFVKAAYIIGGYRFSADDVEHGVLRQNRGNPAIPGPQFVGSDPRFTLQMPILDPRIHFTLVCASSSCPPIGFYRPENMDQQLTVSAKNFINGGEAEIDLESRTVTLSKIFQWYAPDFGGNVVNQLGFGKFDAVLKFIAPFVTDETKREMLLNETSSFSVRFKPYNWGLNLLY